MPVRRLRPAALGLSLVVAAGALPALTWPAAAGTSLSIAQIQGTGVTTPYAGDQVTTRPSVVTAVYQTSTSDFRGFVIQTPGTGGRHRDLTKASDAVFVYLGSRPYDVSIGDVVTVTGQATEFSGLTEIAGSVTVTRVHGRYPAVRPLTGLSWSRTAAHRENLESMLLAPTQRFTVSDTDPLLAYGELGLTAGALPVQPTDAAPAGTAAATARAARNEADMVSLDDGTNARFTQTVTSPGRRLPYLTRDHRVAVGDTVRIHEAVIVDYRNGGWTFNPTIAAPGEPVASVRHRTTPGRPRVGGAVSVASFNVLNYFTTVGRGRAGCTGGNLDRSRSYNVTFDCDVRGAWDAADLRRQQAKIVSAVNRLDASVVGLMEIENSAKLGEPADEATATLVAALNRAAGSRRWDYVRSSDQLPALAAQDVITSALIYQRAEVTPGRAYALGAAAGPGRPFSNARTPIAASFSPVGGGDPVLVVVNHFKSKSGSGATGDNDPKATEGQGAFNGDRRRQAAALRDWVPTVQAATGTQAVALVGDFNSYTQEDPLRVLYAAGYTNAASPKQYSYVFDGLSGSLDHILLNAAAAHRLTQARVWNINAGQSTALEYSTYNTTALDYYRPDALRSSDHDPVVAGLAAR